MLIVFEGINGAGKTTMINKTFNWLMGLGKQLVLTKEPRGYFKQCANIKNINPRARALLYLAGRAFHTQKIILPNIANKIILCDRYLDSSIAYQVLGEGMNLDLFNQMNDFASYGTRPDLTIYLNVSVENGMSRSGSTDQKLQEQAQKGYEYLKTINKDYVEIDANQSQDEVFKAIQEAIKKKLEI